MSNARRASVNTQGSRDVDSHASNVLPSCVVAPSTHPSRRALACTIRLENRRDRAMRKSPSSRARPRAGRRVHGGLSCMHATSMHPVRAVATRTTRADEAPKRAARIVRAGGAPPALSRAACVPRARHRITRGTSRRHPRTIPAPADHAQPSPSTSRAKGATRPAEPHARSGGHSVGAAMPSAPCTCRPSLGLPAEGVDAARVGRRARRPVVLSRDGRR